MHGDSRDSVAERRMLLLSVKEVSRKSFVCSFVRWIFEEKKIVPSNASPVRRSNLSIADSLSSFRSDLRKVRPMRGEARCAPGERNTGWIHGTRTSVDTVGSNRTPEKFNRF